MQCEAGHRYSDEAGVLRLVTPEFGLRVAGLEAALAKQRATRPVLDPADYDQLPQAMADHDREWRVRAEDVHTISRLLPPGQSLSILDVGAWNGWLSHRLATEGHSVLAADYFPGAPDGLAAKAYFTSRFDAVQIDLTDLDPLGREFDLAVINHGLAFFSDPHAQLREVLSRVRAGGTLVVLGLKFFRRPAQRADRVRQMRADFAARFATELFLQPTRGLLDVADRRRLEKAGLCIRPYSCMRLQNIRSLLDGRRPYHCYGIMRVTGGQAELDA